MLAELSRLQLSYEDDETPQPQKTRAYVFTLNNWTDEEYQKILTLNYKYIAIGDEIAPKTGTPHLQGYIYFERETSRNTIKKFIPRGWYRRARGTAKQNLTYCSKSSLLYEDGVMPEQGKRRDIDEMRDYLDSTPHPKMRDICKKQARSLQGIKLAEHMLKYIERERDTFPDVYWFYGPTGTGKSYTAKKMFPRSQLYKKDKTKWWEGYDAHEAILIDDLRFHSYEYDYLLTLLDETGNRLECKNGSRQNLADTIIITSPYTPREMFENKITEDIGQLERRIKEIRYFDIPYEKPEK